MTCSVISVVHIPHWVMALGLSFPTCRMRDSCIHSFVQRVLRLPCLALCRALQHRSEAYSITGMDLCKLQHKERTDQFPPNCGPLLKRCYWNWASKDFCLSGRKGDLPGRGNNVYKGSEYKRSAQGLPVIWCGQRVRDTGLGRQV